MKKGFIRKISTILIFAVLCVSFCFSTSDAGTVPPLLRGNLIWNIESIYYYVHSSASAYLTPIADAAHNWVYTGHGWNNLYPNQRTTKIIDSAIDIYAYAKSDGVNGYTTFWARTNVTSGTAYQVSYNNNWLYNEINLNNTYLSKKTNTYKHGVIAHEMGHCFGLNENNTNKYSIMCQAGYGRAVTTVQEVDQIAFNKKHP